MFLDTGAEAAIQQRVARLEAATGVEAVAAVIARADSYPEIPWKAFALGASVGAAAALAAVAVDPGWAGIETVVGTVVAVLATGAAAALATVWIAPLARLLLPRPRAQAEVLQYAQAMFLESGLQGTRRRDAVLLLVSLFEREVVVLADRGLRDRLDAAALDRVVRAATAELARGGLEAGLHAALARLEETLVARGFRARPDEADELSNTVIQQRGTT